MATDLKGGGHLFIAQIGKCLWNPVFCFFEVKEVYEAQAFSKIIFDARTRSRDSSMTKTRKVQMHHSLILMDFFRSRNCFDVTGLLPD